MATGLEVSILLAIPSVIDCIFRGGEALYTKIDEFRKVDQTMANYREIAYDIKEGTLCASLRVLRGASRDRLMDSAVLHQVVRVLDNVKSNLEASNKALSHVRESTIKGKLKYTIWKGKGSLNQLDKQFKSLKSAYDDLMKLCLQLHIYRTAQSPFYLTSDVFKLTHEDPENPPGYFLPNSDVFVAGGNYLENEEVKFADFILEKKLEENDVSWLCTKLNEEEIGDLPGILPVLGYRHPPYNEPDGSKVLQLVIELPENTRAESLAHWIRNKPCPSVVDRLELCQSLARAVQSIHTLTLVHKAIRSRAILMLSPKQNLGLGATSLYLQDWTCIRNDPSPTAQMGESEWQRAIYQHPDRQGKYAETSYNRLHDIYSLGVCMLEILLWKPLIVTTTGPSTETHYDLCQPFKSRVLAIGEQNGGPPSKYKENPAKLTSYRWATKKVWCDVARSELNDPQLEAVVLNSLEERFESVAVVLSELEGILEERSSLQDDVSANPNTI